MTIEDFAKQFGLSTEKARGWIYNQKDWLKANGNKKVYGEWNLTSDDLKELATIRYNRMRGIDHSIEFDIDTMHEYIHKSIPYYTLNKLALSKGFPKYCEIGWKKKRVWDKKEVINFFKTKFDHNTGKAKKPRQLSQEASTIVYFCTGRYWRYGEQVTTNIHHAREV